ncbi:hypothetical protein [Paraferrimonas haliotis]|uniref:Membrane protein n=1 Tax=Paraferrimonas haliotis TaxID=2013866 RepID=A0AA37TSJ8_9GAMM|nr:hypothetical protein [Paraferrimonas haliotis]GLS82090.1 membrane protein [Paraferrimonas haliotis]
MAFKPYVVGTLFMSVSVILTEALNFFRSQGKALFLVCFPLLLVQNGLQMWVNSQLPTAEETQGLEVQLEATHYIAVLLLLLVLFHMYACVTLFLHTRSQGQQLNASQIWLGGLHYVPSMMLAGVISAVAVMMAMMPAIISGFFPLAILALWVGVRLAYVNFMVVVEGATPLASVTECFKFSGAIFWQTLMVLGLLIPISLVTAVADTAVAQGPMVLRIVVNALFAYVGLFITVALFRLYMVNRQPTVTTQSEQQG